MPASPAVDPAPLAPPPALPSEARLEARACEFFATWGLLDRLAHVEVIWNRRLRTTAGRALPKRLQIQLNPRLLARVPAQLDEVLAHEAAHLATALVHGVGVPPHGPQWADFMAQLGLPPRTTHDFPVDGLRAQRSYFLHHCHNCGDRRILDNSRAPRNCNCDPRGLSVYRAPRSPRGRNALEQFHP